MNKNLMFWENDVIVAGPLKVELCVSVTGSDAYFIVKLIEALPDSR